MADAGQAQTTEANWSDRTPEEQAAAVAQYDPDSRPAPAPPADPHRLEMTESAATNRALYTKRFLAMDPIGKQRAVEAGMFDQFDYRGPDGLWYNAVTNARARDPQGISYTVPHPSEQASFMPEAGTSSYGPSAAEVSGDYKQRLDALAKMVFAGVPLSQFRGADAADPINQSLMHLWEEYSRHGFDMPRGIGTTQGPPAAPPSEIGSIEAVPFEYQEQAPMTSSVWNWGKKQDDSGWSNVSPTLGGATVPGAGQTVRGVAPVSMPGQAPGVGPVTREQPQPQLPPEQAVVTPAMQESAAVQVDQAATAPGIPTPAGRRSGASTTATEFQTELHDPKWPGVKEEEVALAKANTAYWQQHKGEMRPYAILSKLFTKGSLESNNLLTEDEKANYRQLDAGWFKMHPGISIPGSDDHKKLMRLLATEKRPANETMMAEIKNILSLAKSQGAYVQGSAAYPGAPAPQGLKGAIARSIDRLGAQKYPGLAPYGPDGLMKPLDELGKGGKVTTGQLSGALATTEANTRRLSRNAANQAASRYRHMSALSRERWELEQPIVQAELLRAKEEEEIQSQLLAQLESEDAIHLDKRRRNLAERQEEIAKYSSAVDKFAELVNGKGEETLMTGPFGSTFRTVLSTTGIVLNTAASIVSGGMIPNYITDTIFKAVDVTVKERKKVLDPIFDLAGLRKFGVMEAGREDDRLRARYHMDRAAVLGIAIQTVKRAEAKANTVVKQQALGMLDNALLTKQVQLLDNASRMMNEADAKLIDQQFNLNRVGQGIITATVPEMYTGSSAKKSLDDSKGIGWRRGAREQVLRATRLQRELEAWGKKHGKIYEEVLRRLPKYNTFEEFAKESRHLFPGSAQKGLEIIQQLNNTGALLGQFQARIFDVGNLNEFEQKFYQKLSIRSWYGAGYNRLRLQAIQDIINVQDMVQFDLLDDATKDRFLHVFSGIAYDAVMARKDLMEVGQEVRQENHSLRAASSATGLMSTMLEKHGAKVRYLLRTNEGTDKLLSEIRRHLKNTGVIGAGAEDSVTSPGVKSPEDPLTNVTNAPKNTQGSGW